MSNSSYIHGSSAEEHERLGWMNSLLNGRELAVIASRGDERALEMGAGTAIFARALAEHLPRGSVVAIERDAQQIAAAQRTAAGCRNLELRQGDALAPPLQPAEWGSFDLVHARFLLEHLEKPEQAVHVMARAARAGGRIVLVDDDHEIMRPWPEPPGFVPLWRAYCEQYVRRGMDPYIGRRLVSLLHEAGAHSIRSDMIHFGANAGMPAFGAASDNLIGVLEGAAEAIAGSGAVRMGEIRAALDALRVWQKQPDAAAWYALPIAIGVR